MEEAYHSADARPNGIHSFEDLKRQLAEAAVFRAARDRPFVVLSYAQSVDGSIAGRRRERIRLSGPESMRLTYSIRGLCDTILVGIGTVLADDPRLMVGEAAGPNPHPIVLDSRLRTPVEARLLSRPDARPWLVHGPHVPASRARALIAAGAEPVPCNTEAGGRIHLPALMRWLAEHGINSVMVEGGARVITSFIREQLADVFVVTISPQFLGGLPVIDMEESSEAVHLEFGEASFQTLGRDLVLWARPHWAVP